MEQQAVVLFIDRQNFYKGARRAFFSESDLHYYGQFHPVKLGMLLCSRSVSGVVRTLKQVRVYIGRPDASKEPKTYSAHMKQCAAWQLAGVEVVHRGLRYPPDWPISKAQEKGVDVALAIDFVAMAIDGDYEMGVIASTDSDLRPALEYVQRKCQPKCRVQTAAWISPRTSSTLYIPGSALWCHRLNRTDYDSVADLTDYNQ